MSAGDPAAPRIHDTGAGAALLFLHAFPLDSSQWDHQVAALSGKYRCLRVDMWGCGASPSPPDETSTLDDFAAATLRGLDSVGVASAAVIGLSMGGYVAFALHRAARDRITAMVLCSTRASADSDAARAERISAAERAIREDSVEFAVEPSVNRLLGQRARNEVHVTDPLRGRIRRWSPAGFSFAQRAMAARPDSTAMLGGIDVPTLVISGAEDAVVPAIEVRAMADAIPKARYLEMSLGHLTNLEDPHGYNAALLEFLHSVPDPR